MSGFKTCDRMWKAGVKNSGMLQGDYPGSYRPVSRPAMALRNVRGMLLAASQGKPRELGGGSVLQPWGIPLRVTMVAMVAIAPRSWDGASWEPSKTVAHQGSSHPLPTPRGGETLVDAACHPAWLPSAPPLPSSLLVSIPASLLLITDGFQEEIKLLSLGSLGSVEINARRI